MENTLKENNHQQGDMSVEVLVPQPLFSRQHVDGWLLQLDAYFTLHKITEDAAKYYTVIVAIDPDIVVQLPKFEEPKYEKLTRWLKAAYGLKQEDIFRQALRDQTAATLFGAVSSPASPVTAIPLPPTNTPASSVTAVAMPTDPMSVFCDRFSKMLEGWEAKLASAVPVQTTPRTRFTNYSPAPSRRRGEYCYYHHTFGRRARQCEPPCAYPSGNGEWGSFL